MTGNEKKAPAENYAARGVLQEEGIELDGVVLNYVLQNGERSFNIGNFFATGFQLEGIITKMVMLHNGVIRFTLHRTLDSKNEKNKLVGWVLAGPTGYSVVINDAEKAAH